ncbi:MAG TPA: class I SAM-dependent methyltransferase [Bryobacteraceae bacterium]|nr:class I SAM-dependent methyltransferase [Bryobacteraceae bacterium]
MMQDTMPHAAEFWNDIAWEFDSIYSGADKNAFRRALDRFFRQDVYQRFKWVMEKCGDVEGQSICDVGCGSGRFVAEFLRRGAGHVTGVDIAPTMLALARNLVEQDGSADRCEFVLNDVLHWNAARRFDITVAIGFWDYIGAPLERLRVIRRLTGGTFLSAWPRFWTWRALLRKIRLQCFQGCPVYFYRRSEVLRVLEAAGFEVARCDSVGKLFCVEAHPKSDPG